MEILITVLNFFVFKCYDVWEKKFPGAEKAMLVALLLTIDKASPGLGDKFSPSGYLLKAVAILHLLVAQGVGNSGQGTIVWEVCRYYYQTWEQICIK